MRERERRVARAIHSPRTVAEVSVNVTTGGTTSTLVRTVQMAYNGNRLKVSNGNEAKDGPCKIVLLGSPGVGKTGQ